MIAATAGRDRTALWLVMAVAVAVAIASVGNGFTYDDVPMIVDNERVTALQAPWDYFTQSYWPNGGLYRPVTVWLLALLWRVGGGLPLLFHCTNVVLQGLATGLVFALTRRALPTTWAALAALVFAVHPVHVEAVANAVGISELLCTILVLGAVLLSLSAQGEPLTAVRRLGAVGLVLLAAFTKEEGFMTPALLFVAALTTGLADRFATVRRAVPIVLAMSAVLGGVLLLRIALLTGPAGDQPAAPLRTLGPAPRALVSLGTVPSWTRLLLWPARLSFDYTPPGFRVATTPGPVHLLALLLLGAAAWLAWSCRERARAVTFGLCWTFIALLPVSNLLVPTGILLAERTLYLPSVGLAIAVGGLAQWIWEQAGLRAVRPVLLASICVVLVLGAWRSVVRAHAWRDNAALLRDVDTVAANNYRAHRTRALYLDRAGHLDEAAREYHRSIALWNQDPKVYENLALLLQRQGHIEEAMAVLADGLQVDPTAPAMRSKLFYLHLNRGDWPAARETALAGLSQSDTMFAALVRRADSALATSTPPPSIAGQ